ncbi:MAG: hypothetical protein ACRCXD_08185 [Luteolibacter sp.]
MQREAIEAQMDSQFQMNLAQLKQDHESRTMVKTEEHQRAQRNLVEKMMDDAAADAMTQLKNSQEKMSGAASA